MRVAELKDDMPFFAGPRAAECVLPIKSRAPVYVVLDAVALLSSAVVAHAGYRLIANYTTFNFSDAALLGALSTFLFLIICAARRHYETIGARGAWRLSLQALSAWFVTFATVSIVAFIMKTNLPLFSRGSVLAFFALGGVWLVFSRTKLVSILESGALPLLARKQRVALIGDRDMIARIKGDKGLVRRGVEIRGSWIVEGAGDAARHAAEAMMRSLRGEAVDRVVVALPLSRWSEVQQLRKSLRTLPLPVWLVTHRMGDELFRRETAPEPLAHVMELHRDPLDTWGAAQKRMLDFVVASIALVTLLPLLAVVALAVKLSSPGPVIFRQMRTGVGGRTFWVYKFRTMSVTEDGETFSQARKNDARITSVGAILRRTSIDELPQLFNVLQGDMSLVGPRPHALAHNREFEALIAGYGLRHYVKPGITGLAQVNGFRGETASIEAMERRVENDFAYIENWSLLLDLRILFMTAFEVFRGRNAH